MKTKVLYQHKRLDNNKIFYVGIRTESRAYSKHSRNKHWNNIINKTEYKVEILKYNLSVEEAFDLEKILISWYGRNNLSNMTDGGDGCKNLCHTIESRKKMSKSHTGKKLSKESILKRTKHFYKKIINIETKEIYKNIDEILKTYNDFNKVKLRNQLNGTTINYSNFIYLEDYKNKILIRKQDNKRKQVIDITNNIIYKSMLEASKKNNIPLSTLNKYLKNIITNKSNLRFYNETENNN